MSAGVESNAAVRTTTKARMTKRTATPTTKPVVAGSANSCRAIRIMPLGDSLTAFGESYRGPLFRTLVAQRRKVDFVGSVRWEPTGGGDPDGEGHGGFTIGPDDRKDNEGKPSNIAAYLDRWLAAAKPDVVLLTIGTNDMAGGGDFTEKAPSKLKALVATIQKSLPNAVIAVSDVPPSIYTPNNTPAFDAMSRAAKSLADASTTGRTLYAPTVQRLRDLGFNAEKDTTDGVHFTVAGGEMFAKAWLPSVDEAFRRLPNLC